jgi:hypothetical protein
MDEIHHNIHYLELFESIWSTIIPITQYILSLIGQWKFNKSASPNSELSGKDITRQQAAALGAGLRMFLSALPSISSHQAFQNGRH